ncbi:MAG TPA: type IV toxin-antitoxin system AbiEi family antitoxin domain-containing protein [Solirubrobacteraceae bacterium]|jgi:predicted transcriptional regulator of viral defense system|nr:type IV toxin-antitoxin system AbiEi family antitoxin domain-containing protein [Solirubrobacteraceae bacterium]
MARVAARHWGVITLAQLLAIGFTYREVELRVERGWLHRIYAGVYCVGHPQQLSRRGQLYAAVVAAGPGAFLSHQTAAADRGLRPFNLREIHVTVPADRTPAKRPGLVLHRTTTEIHRSDVSMYYGLRVATVPRLLVEVSRDERPRELQRLIAAAVHKQVFDPEAVGAAIERHARRPGISVLRAAFARYDPTAPDHHSQLERSFQRHQRGDRRMPVPVYHLKEGIWEIDVAWSEQRVALELDGRPYHVAVQDFDRDRRKDRKLKRAAWITVRVSDFEWDYDRQDVLDDLYALLGA